MGIQADLLRRLDHLGQTVTVEELAADPARSGVALRHDVDHDLDLALEVARHEHARGMRATYFLLHTAPYWSSPALGDKCRQLSAYGHEIGLHVNVLSEWMSGAIDDVEARIAELLTHLRELGVVVTGVSAHGDRRCYDAGFINTWIWRELRGDDPIASQRGLSPEAVPTDDPQRQIPYPADHCLRRPDGSVFELWSVPMSPHGLRYDAANVSTGTHWSDTGGSWGAAGDPLGADLTAGRHQVLIHPHWWRGESRVTFVLSAARSGSRWLANFVDRATSARGLHEWTLNHRREGDLFPADNRTSRDYAALVERPGLAADPIRAAVAHHRLLRRDVLEANVYLEPFVERLTEQAPDATLVHLHRDGRDVVRSLLQRDWYDSPLDLRHRSVPVPEWDALSQLERACWYWRYTQERLIEVTDLRWSFERMAGDLDHATTALAELGIAVHPQLAGAVHRTPVNATDRFRVPPFDRWPDAYRQTFERICGSVQRELGYGAGEAELGLPAGGGEPAGRSAMAAASPTVAEERPTSAAMMISDEACTLEGAHASPHGVEAEMTDQGLVVRTLDRPNNAGHVLIARGDGGWHGLSAGSGYPCQPDSYYAGEVTIAPEATMGGRLFALAYGADGNQVMRQPVVTLRPNERSAIFTFTLPDEATHYALAVHVGDQPALRTLVVEMLTHRALHVDDDYRARFS